MVSWDRTLRLEVVWERLPSFQAQVDVNLNVVIHGETNSGKTTLLGSLYGVDHELDRGSIFLKCNDNIIVNIHLSAEQPRGGIRANPQNTDLHLFVFDITSYDTFEWVVRYKDRDGMFMIVGTKSDLEETRAVDVLPCKAVPRYMEVSALTGKNTDALLTRILNYLSFRIVPGRKHEKDMIEKLEAENHSVRRLKPKNDFNWRFMKNNELQHLSRDYGFRISMYGPDEEVKALIKSIQTHGPCTSSNATEVSVYVLYASKNVIQLKFVAVGEAHGYLPVNFDRSDLDVQSFSVARLETFLSAANEVYWGTPMIILGIIPDESQERKVFYGELKDYFDVCPSTYMNVERFVEKVLQYLQHRILPSEPTFIHEETWIDYPEPPPTLDEDDPCFIQYKTTLARIKSTSDDLFTDVTWRWFNDANETAKYSMRQMCLNFVAAPEFNVNKLPTLILELQPHTNSDMLQVLYEDRIHLCVSFTVNYVQTGFDVLRVPTLQLVCFNIDSIESFQDAVKQAPPISTYLQVLFVGLKLSTTPESSRQVFLQHFDNTTERYIEVCIDKQESVQELISKIVYCSTQWIDFHREITQKELDQAFEGVIDPDDLYEF